MFVPGCIGSLRTYTVQSRWMMVRRRGLGADRRSHHLFSRVLTHVVQGQQPARGETQHGHAQGAARPRAAGGTHDLRRSALVMLDRRRIADTHTLAGDARIEPLVQDLHTLERNWLVLHASGEIPRRDRAGRRRVDRLSGDQEAHVLGQPGGLTQPALGREPRAGNGIGCALPVRRAELSAAGLLSRARM
jgi:hypothetical protein